MTSGPPGLRAAPRLGFVLLLAAATLPGPAGAAPRVALSTQRLDFGAIGLGERVAREIALSNSGDAELILGEIRSFSRAVTAVGAPGTIPPGGAGVLRVEVAATGAGLIDTKLLVKTNDPQQPSLVVLVTADAAPWYVIDPNLVSFGAVSPGCPGRAERPIRFRAGSGLSITSVGASLPFVKVATRAGADSLETLVVLTVAPDAPVGPFEGSAHLVVSRSPADTVRIGLAGVVVRRWRVSPNPFYVSLTKFVRKPPVLVCQRAVDAPARILEATCSIPGCAPTVLVSEEGQLYRIVIADNPAWPAGEQRGEIRIRTSDPKEPEIVIPMTLVVGAGRPK